MKVLSFGEILFDIIEGQPYLGGAPLNFAGHLARLGAESYIISAVGNDALGQQALQQIEQLGVKTDYIQIHQNHPTGTVPVSISNGQPEYEILEGVAWEHIDWAGQLGCTNFDVLYFGTLAQRHEVSRNTLKKLLSANQFRQVFYDINLRKGGYTEALVRDSLQHCSILKLNDEEVNVLSQLIWGQEYTPEAFAVKIEEDWGIGLVIITAGAAGCYVLEGGRVQFVPGYPAQVVDTVGAGDAFSAAFLYHFLRSGDALAAADKANRLGAFVASSRGPLPVYTNEIKGLMRS